MALAHRIARRLVALASVLVPRGRRADWRREWEAELWYQQSNIIRRSAGAVPHALWLRQRHWSLDMAIDDVRYALRLLARSPGFTLVSVATLALAVAANTAIFSVVRSVLWRPLRFHDPGRLVQLWETNPDRGWTEAECAPANVADWQRLNRSFVGLAAYIGGGREPMLSDLALTGLGDPQPLKAASVTANFFSVLGVDAAIGRTFAAQEEFRGQDSVVVLSADFWQARLGGDPSIVGHPMLLNGRARTVIGIVPRDFRFERAPVDVWIPIGWAASDPETLRRPHILRVIGRLKPDVSIEQARVDLQHIARDLERAYPTTNAHMGVGVGSLSDWVVGPVRQQLLLFLAAVGAVLCVACANVANLLLARGVSRQRELSIRAALGATRTRVVRQMLTESLVLASLSGVAGLLVAYAAVRVIVTHGPPSLPRLHEVTIDPVALAFTMTLTIFTGIVFGVMPARRVASSDGASLLRTFRQAGSSSRSRARSILVITELALSLVLLIGSTLLIRSFVKLNQVALGFEPRGVVGFHVSLPRSAYPGAAEQRAVIERLLTRVRALPGVLAAGAAQRMVLTGLWSSDFTVEHRAPTDFGIDVHHNAITPGYLASIGGMTVRGRDIAESDAANSPLVVLVNEALVRRYFANQDPIGHRLNFDRPGGSSPWRTIVGVVRDFHEEQVDTEPRPTIYEALLQIGNSAPSVALRMTDGSQIAGALHAAIREVDANLPIVDIRPLEDLVRERLAPQMFSTAVMVLFAGIAVTLTVIGLYGVLAYLTMERTQEIGIRIALGASRSDIARDVALQASKLVTVGLAIGWVVSLSAGRLLSGLLFQIQTADPITYLSVTLMLFLVASAATAVPIIRASGVSPLTALRSDG